MLQVDNSSVSYLTTTFAQTTADIGTKRAPTFASTYFAMPANVFTTGTRHHRSHIIQFTEMLKLNPGTHAAKCRLFGMYQFR